MVRGMVAELSPRKCLRNGLWVKLINITNRLSSFVCACYVYTAMCFLVIFLFSVKQASISHVFRFKYLVDTHTYTTAIDDLLAIFLVRAHCCRIGRSLDAFI